MEFKNIKEKIKGILDPEIIGVNAPYASLDKNNRIVRWTLDVTYRDFGRKSFVFNVDDEVWYTTYKGPLEAAKSAYGKYFDTMQRQQAEKFARQR